MFQNGQTEPAGVTRRRTKVRRQGALLCNIVNCKVAISYKIRKKDSNYTTLQTVEKVALPQVILKIYKFIVGVGDFDKPIKTARKTSNFLAVTCFLPI